MKIKIKINKIYLSHIKELNVISKIKYMIVDCRQLILCYVIYMRVWVAKVYLYENLKGVFVEQFQYLHNIIVFTSNKEIVNEIDCIQYCFGIVCNGWNYFMA